MELFMGCVLLAIGIGVLIFKAVLFGLFMSYPQPGEDLKWKRAPSLPMQELSRRFARGSSRKSDRSLPRGRVIGGGKTRPEPAIPARSDGSSSKLDFPHPERVPLEVINIDVDDDDFDFRHQTYPREPDAYGTIV